MIASRFGANRYQSSIPQVSGSHLHTHLYVQMMPADERQAIAFRLPV